MLSKAKTLLQVTVLTMVLVFSGLLVMGSLDFADRAEAAQNNPHYGTSYYFGISISFINLHFGGDDYYSPP